MSYYRLEIEAPIPDCWIELATGSYRCLGVEQGVLDENIIDKCLGVLSYCGGEISEETLEKLEELTQQLPQTFFFAERECAEAFLEYLRHSLEINGKIKKGEDEDWVSSWKKYYKTQVVGSVDVVPSWEKGKWEESNTTIYINPGQGFGTGTHETTQLCLEMYQDIKKEIIGNVLDFGCGSGILGIGAQKLSQINVEYFDIDIAALENCLDNLVLNDLSPESSIVTSRKEELSENYQLVFANILAPVLKEEANYLCSLDAEYLILSGLLDHQVEDVMMYYAAKYSFKKVKERNTWMSLLLIKK